MKYILSLFLLSALLFSCENFDGSEKDERIAELEETNEELAREAAEKDSVLRAVDETFASISRNLAMIRESEESIRLESGDVEMTVDQREAIEAEIQDINALLQSNREQIAELNATISRFHEEVGRYKNLIASMEEQIAQKDQEISDLKKNLVAANFTIDILNKMNEELADEIRSNQGTIETMTDNANTVHYVIGTFQELKEKGIAERAGILAGKKVQQDFVREDFVDIDRREVKEINLSSMSAEVLSNHPSGSYEFVGESDEDYKLVINDPKEFWSITDYLVVQIK